MSSDDHFEVEFTMGQKVAVIGIICGTLVVLALITWAVIIGMGNVQKDRAVRVACVQAGATWINNVCLNQGPR